MILNIIFNYITNIIFEVLINTPLADNFFIFNSECQKHIICFFFILEFLIFLVRFLSVPYPSTALAISIIKANLLTNWNLYTYNNYFLIEYYIAIHVILCLFKKKRNIVILTRSIFHLELFLKLKFIVSNWEQTFIKAILQYNNRKSW